MSAAPPLASDLLAQDAWHFVMAKYTFDSVLDIGAGAGLHANAFRALGKRVTTVTLCDDYGTKADYVADFIELDIDEQFDLVWCSHVLEHQRNVGQFLEKIFRVLKPGGILAVTVPPGKDEVVGGHVSVWNAGVLVYNLVLAGFDCRDASVLTAGYNVSVVLRKRLAVLPSLRMDEGDIEKLAQFFPVPAYQGFDGRIARHNWDRAPDARPPAGEAQAVSELSIRELATRMVHGADDLEHLRWCCKTCSVAGPALEFGVFKGRSLMLLAEEFRPRRVYGFDSFEGLPEDWHRGPGNVYTAGHFAVESLPMHAENATLVRGWFDDSIPRWLQQHPDLTQVALLHIDSDLYSSAATVLKMLNHLIVPGTVIVFDELCDWRDSGVYPLWQEGEWLAFKEWMGAHDRRARPLASGPLYAGSYVVSR